MPNHDLDPKLYDLLVETGIIDPNKVKRPTEEYVISSDSKQIKDRQYKVYILYELGTFAAGVLVLIIIFTAIALGIGLVYLLA